MAILDDDMSGGLDYDEFIMQFRFILHILDILHVYLGRSG